jgi:hypothetical protein
VPSDPASVQAVDLAVVNDQTIARQLRCEGSLLRVQRISASLVVQPLTDQEEPSL